MLGITNTKKRTVFNGIGVALLLCALMALMPMAGFVNNNAGDVEFVTTNDTTENQFSALPDTIKVTEYENEPSDELIGMRDQNSKTFIQEDGKFVQITHEKPVHFLDDGSWSDIDLNIAATASGWGVTDNSFTTQFAPEMAYGVSLQVNQFVDPIILGMNPMLLTLDETGAHPQPFEAAPSEQETTVGGNMIRYPVAEGFALDYTVESTSLKQNLVISERPILEPNTVWFGFSEMMVLPSGYGLFAGGDILGEELTQTQESIDIRNIDTGELLAVIPAPAVKSDYSTLALDVDSEPTDDEYLGTYFIQVIDSTVLISTVVEGEWLMSDDRVFPLAIDPTIVLATSGGSYCYAYYDRCYGSGSTYYTPEMYKYGSDYRHAMYQKYTFSSSSALPTGATVDAISHHNYYDYKQVSSYYRPYTIRASVLESCGTNAGGYYTWAVPSANCSGVLPSSTLAFTTTQYGSSSIAKAVTASIANSAHYDTISEPSLNAWESSDICISATTCASGSALYVTNALTNGGTIGIGHTIPTFGILRLGVSTSGATNSYIKITYSGGSDSDAPVSSFIAYTGVDSYVEGPRTLFTTLVDSAGIDTTAANKPTLNYAFNNATNGRSSTRLYTSVGATSIGTCSSATTSCQFSATIPTVSAGDFVEYYWKFQDINPAGQTTPNVGYDPALTTGQAVPTPYSFTVKSIDDAGDEKKIVVLTTGVSSGSYRANTNIDRQQTHWEGSNEFYFEFDTSKCGTGTSQCWFATSVSYAWQYDTYGVQHTTKSSTGSFGMARYISESSGVQLTHQRHDGYISTDAKDGPGMNILYHFNTAENAFAMVGIGSSPSINEKLAGGADAPKVPVLYRGFVTAYKIPLESDNVSNASGAETYGGEMGLIGFGNATGGAGVNANRLCVTSNGFTYFYRTQSGVTDQCQGSIFDTGSNSGTPPKAYSGFAHGMSYYGVMSANGGVTYKISTVKPLPDTFAPEIVHSVLKDSHSKTRTVSMVLSDAGSPPSGLNVSTTALVGPTVTYRVTPAGGTPGLFYSLLMSPTAGTSRASCALETTCTWSADININKDTGEEIERGSSVSYYLTAQDVSNASSSPNTVTTTTETYMIGDPTKMFIVEWRDQYYSSEAWTCSYQAVFYDVTNEIEFKYDDACKHYRDGSTIGFMDKARTAGQSISWSTSGNYFRGSKDPAVATNYRITTDSGDGSYETFDSGMTPLVNAESSDIMGTSGGYNPSTYQCSRYFGSYSNQCADNIPMPEGFNFTYFGTDYNHTDPLDRIQISRHGNMHFIDNGQTSLIGTTSNWYAAMKDMPSTTYGAPALIAPYWSYYGTNYCKQSNSVDCGVYYRTVPFEGKGTDISSDITEDTTWDLEDSPVRLNPSNDYLSISAELTIQPGVVIQVASNKGISFDGACDQMMINGNSSHHVVFEGLNNATWLGMAFTDSCPAATDPTGTDNRHVFSYVDFKNTSDNTATTAFEEGAAIVAGSRHGDTPSDNGNVGNFTMDHVTFTNVRAAFTHGSGLGTVVSMTEFSVNGASGSCFDFAANSVVSLTEGVMTNCNTGAGANNGTIHNTGTSSAGSLFLENVTITNSLRNLIDVDLTTVTVSNVTVSTPLNSSSAYDGHAFASAAGANSEVVLNNFDASGYSSVLIHAMHKVMLTDVDFGSTSMSLYPGGVSSPSSPGPYGDNAVFDDITAGIVVLRNIQPGTFDNVTSDDLSITGNPIAGNSDIIFMNNLVADEVRVVGCGWKVTADNMAASLLVSNGCSAARNIVLISGSTITHTSPSLSAVYARHSDVTLGESAVTSTTADNSSVYLASVSLNSNIRLIAVTQNGSQCADASGTTHACFINAAEPTGEVWFGGLATVRTYRMALVNAVSTQIFKSGHTVIAKVLTGSPQSDFGVGSHITDSAGSANVWVITGDASGNVYSTHKLNTFGPAGQNETTPADSWYPTIAGVPTYTLGSTIDLLLEPAPVDFDGAAMDCAWMDNYVDPSNGAQLPTNGTTAAGYSIFEFDGTPMTLSADLNLDGCKMVLKGSSLKVVSTTLSSPVLTLSNGGSLVVTTSPDTGAVGALLAIDDAYGLHLDIVSGSLILDGGILQDVAQNSLTGAALMIGEGATLRMLNGGTIYGASTTDVSMSTVKIDGGTVNIADSSIINSGKTGTALWVQNAGGSIGNILVKNAAIGIQSFKGAPQVDGFTATNNTVGLDVYGSMSLPIIYRSTILGGVKPTGWATYKIDLSTYLEDDYLQVGYNSIYGGGNAHPLYNSYYNKYYMITDRYNIELEDVNGNAWNITSASDEGYYPYSAADPASGDGSHATYTEGAAGGVPSWDCNTYGYEYGPNYQSSFDGFFPYIWRYFTGNFGSYPAYYQSPPQLGYDWEDLGDGLSPEGYGSNYPYHYFGYSYTSYHGGQGAFKPPEGYVTSNYNVCLDSASYAYTDAGQGARLTMPMVDISASNLSKVSVYIDVLHNRADNYEDRIEFVARSSNNVATLIGDDYVSASGIPLFKNGTINGADTGIEIGGEFAAAHFENIQVNSPSVNGLEITGQTTSSVDGLTVTGGLNGVLVGSSAYGSVELLNLSLDQQTTAGVYYANDIGGELSGSVTNNSGAAFYYGVNTQADVAFGGISISSNAIGIQTDGKGDMTLTDVTMGNTQDVVINGISNVDFIEGTIDTSSVVVTGNGKLDRLRQLDVTLTADGVGVADSTVSLLDATGASSGNGITDSAGIVQDITFTTAIVDSTGLVNSSLSGYKVMSIAKVQYFYNNSTDNMGDFRYASQGVTLTDGSGNTAAVPLTTRVSDRVCYTFTSTSYTSIQPCNGLGSSGTRTLNDGNGGQMTEYGYSGGLTKSQSNKVLMIDSGIFYLKSATDYDFNGSTILSTGGYSFGDTQRWLVSYPYGATVNMNDAKVYGVGLNEDDGVMYGLEIGGYGSPITSFTANNTIFSNLAKIEMQHGYKSSFRNWEINDVSITNSTISHFRGYTPVNNAVYNIDICIILGGGDGAIVSDNTFTNCAVGVHMQVSPYSYVHAADEFGADNATISNNVFTGGGEMADIWLYRGGYSDDALIHNNVFNSGSSITATIAVYDGDHTRVTISGNTINSLTDGIYIEDGKDYRITGNSINGAGESAYAGISVVRGYGDIDNNSLVDTDGGLIVNTAENPPVPTVSLCSIGAGRWYSQTCTATLVAGKTLDINYEQDYWNSESSLEITLPNGTKDTWARGSFIRNADYIPLVSYTAPGTYVATVFDSYGDGGPSLYMVEGGVAGSYTGPSIADNTIISSPGRLAPAAVGIVFEDCSGVTINSARNNVDMSDNAMVISNCDVVDTSSVLLGRSDNSTVAIDADDVNGDLLTLSGTTISGFATGVKKTSGELTLTGDASLTGDVYGVHVDDASVVAINAAVHGGATGIGLYAVNSDNVWVYPMNASGLTGMYIENSPFRWDGGTSTAVTTLEVVESQGSVENMTWSASSTQINAGSNAYVTSIGNTIDASKLIVATTATIDEANLFTMDSTHLSNAINPVNHSEVAMLIQSTDGSRASYVSTTFQPEIMNVDGSDSDWNGGNALNPSGYAMPGKMSGDGTNDMLVTYIEGDDLYIGLTGEDLSTSDVLIYLSVDASGNNTGYNLGGSHTLPFQANYVLWADSASSTGYALYSYGFLGWAPTTLSSEKVDVFSSSNLTEISIPFSRIGGTPSQIDIITIVQGETDANVSTVHPTQPMDASNTLQSFTEYMTVELTHDDLADGNIANEVLVYRSYKGSNTASAPKNYNVMIKTAADCEYDWATSSNLSLATNIAISLDMERACPKIQASLANITVFEDSDAYTFSLTNLVDDVQDLEVDLSWTSTEGVIDAFNSIRPVDWNQNGHQMTISPLTDQFGTLEYTFEVTDSHGLKDTETITFEVTNINDAPVICNIEELDCRPIFNADDNFTNILAEGFGSHTKSLGDVSNTTRSYIRDMANEQSPFRQKYEWSATIEPTCSAFTVEVNELNSLIITENASNEKGGSCTITLDLSDNGTVNTDAISYTVDFSVAPVNDAPVISLQDENSQNLLTNTAGERATGEGEYLTMTEDDTNESHLTWDLLPLMSDIDHDVPTDLTWAVEATSQCTYTNYFTTAIVGTDLVFTLIPDATTNGYDWEIDYMNENGIHQLRPSGQTFCAISLVLKDTATAPSHTPNYDTSVMNSDFTDKQLAPYSQGQDDVVMYVTIERVAENVADYSIDDVSGIDFKGITNIMTGTYAPVSVNIDAGGDQGPYNYDHMLAVTFHTDGHDEDEFTTYYSVPDYGTSIVAKDYVYITQDTTKVEVSMDVLTCLDAECDLTVPASERFQVDDPQSHRSNSGGSQGSAWSNPGQFGVNATQESQRRPMLEDKYWCNNRLTSLDLETAEANSDWGKCNEYAAGSGSFGATGQALPSVVRTIGASSVASFAPSIIVVSLTGLFVSALAFSSRRADDEEEVSEKFEDNDMAVSPVIATILMVAITVVLSGVIYVWASSLADTDVKGVPRITFDIEDIDSYDVNDGHWRISIRSAETDLATQAIEVGVLYVDANGEQQYESVNLADTDGVYGFNPANSDKMVTFVDQVNSDGDSKVSTFNTGDTIFVRTHDSAGTPLDDVTITLSYAPNVGQGALLRSWSGLSYAVSA